MATRNKNFPLTIKAGSSAVKIYKETKPNGEYYRVCYYLCKGRLKSAAGGAEWRGGRKVQHLQIKKENVARYGTMGRYTP
jgi:hypothetical protein